MAIRRSDKTELRRHQQYYVGPEFIQVNNLDAAAQTDAQEDSGEGGSGSGTPGSMGPLVDLSAFGLTGTAEFLLAQLIRQGEAKFGWVPDTKDPDKQYGSDARVKGPQSHPLLSESQRFDGADPKLNAVPSENPEGQREYDKRHELRPGVKPANTYVDTPTFKPI